MTTNGRQHRSLARKRRTELSAREELEARQRTPFVEHEIVETVTRGDNTITFTRIVMGPPTSTLEPAPDETDSIILPTSTPAVPVITPSTTDSDTETTSESATADETTSTPTTVAPAPATTDAAPIPTTPTGADTTVRQITTVAAVQRTTTTTSASRSLSAASGVASESAGDGSSDESSGGTGGIVGGIIGGIVAIALVAYLLAIFLRRKRKRAAEKEQFSPHEFRRSAMLMPDPPTHADTVAQGFNPPPPVMAQRSPPFNGPSPYGAPPPNHFGQQNQPFGNGFHPGSPHNSSIASDPFGTNPPYPTYPDHHPETPNRAGMGAHSFAGQSQPSWSPGQVVQPNVGIADHYATNPFMNPAPYDASPFTPPVQERNLPDPYQSAPAHNMHMNAPQHMGEQRGGESAAVLVAVGGTAVLTRAVSLKSKGQSQSPPAANVEKHAVTEIQPEHRSTDNPPSNANSAPTADDYLDLSRASVSPYQAAQYAEISRQLNADEPQGMPPPLLEKYVKTADRDLPPIPPVTPQPIVPHLTGDVAPLTPVLRSAPPPLSMPPPAATGLVATHGPDASRASVNSVDSLANVRGADLAEFPIPPPSPVFVQGKYRVDSNPPRLPDFAVPESRMSGLGSYAAQDEAHSGRPAGVGPSPLAASAVPPPPPTIPEKPSALKQELRAQHTGGDADGVPPQRSQAEKANVVAGKKPAPNPRASTYSTYDPEDAYGGI